MMGKLLSVATSFLMGRLTNSTTPTTDFLTTALLLKLRKIGILFGILLTSTIGFALALTKTFEVVGRTMDANNGYLAFNYSLLFCGLALAAFIGVFIYAINPKRWTAEWAEVADEARSALHSNQEHHAKRTNDSPLRPLQELVTVFAADFLKEREARRERKEYEAKLYKEYYEAEVHRLANLKRQYKHDQIVN